MHNRIELIGNVGKIFEPRAAGASHTVIHLSLCTHRHVRRGEEWARETTWHRLVAWDETATNLQSVLAVGDLVHVEGRMTYRTFEHEGREVERAEVVVAAWNLLRKATKRRRAADGEDQNL